MDKIANNIYDLRLASGSKRGYKSGVRFWLGFAKTLNIDPFTEDPKLMERFVIWRFVATNNKSQSIRGNLSQINDFRVSEGMNRVEWTKKNPRLKNLYHVMDMIRPSTIKSEPLVENIVWKICDYLNFKNWTDYTFWVASVLAYSFALRSCEYSETKDYYSPKLNALSLGLSEGGNKVIVYTINSSKANKKGPPEVLKAVCCCPKICLFCTLTNYMKERIKIHKLIPKKYQQYLFLTERSVRVKLNEKKRKYKYIYNRNKIKINDLVPLQSETMKLILKSKLKKFLKNWEKYNLHGYRSGGITDLANLGLSEPILKGISRHSANSLILYRYIRLTPEQVAESVKRVKTFRV